MLANQIDSQVAILDRLVHRAQADGDLRRDIDAGDLALMLDGLRVHPDIQQLPDSDISLADLGGD